MQADQWHNWLGYCQPDACHAIELIDQSNTATACEQLSTRLSQTGTGQPVYVIFCDAQRCAQELQVMLAAHAIVSIHSPLPA